MKKQTQNASVETEEKIETADRSVEENVTEKTTEAQEPETGKIGRLLKEARLSQGRTLAEISQILCIRKVYLEAIEESNYNEIPEFPYGIGFIRSYADFLGMNGNEIVQLYKDEAESNLRKNSDYFVMEPQVEATVPGKKYLMISLFAIAAVYFAWISFSNKETGIEDDVAPVEEALSEAGSKEADFPLKVEDFSTVETTESEIPLVDVSNNSAATPQVTVTNESFVPEAENTGKDAAENNVSVSPAADSEAVNAAAPKSDKIVLKIKKQVWIQVKNDNKLYISKELKEGDSYTIPEDKNLKLSVGIADAVDVTDGEKVIYTVSPNSKMNIAVEDIKARAEQH